MRINFDKYTDVLRQFKTRRSLAELEIFNFDSTIDCYRFVVPQLHNDKDNYAIICIDSISENVVTSYTKQEFLRLFQEAMTFAENKYFGTGLGQDKAAVDISNLVTILKNSFYKQLSKEILVYLKTASALIKVFDIWTHPIFDYSSREEYVDYYREWVQHVFRKIGLPDVYRERENATLKRLLLKQAILISSDENLIDAKKKLREIDFSWMKIGFVGEDFQNLETEYLNVVSTFNEKYRKEEKTVGSAVYNYEQSRLLNLEVKEIKQRPWDFSGDDLSIGPRFW